MPDDTNALRVPIQVLDHGRSNPLPAYQSAHAAAMDLHAALSSEGLDSPADAVVIGPGQIKLIPCGFRMAVPIGYEAQVRPRSGLAVKHGLSMPNTPGTIDADYRGEVCVPLINHGTEPFTVEPGMRIAQLLIQPVPRTMWVEVDHLPDTDRGEGGFGHTGA
jgi:dUTP pyrophosphatase